MARSCLFCGSRSDLTREHVYPKWLYRALKVGGPMTLMLGEEVIRTAPGLDSTLREVCGACNHGWLHDLEHAFRSVMENALLGHIREPTVLNTGAQQVVATWAIKTWLLAKRAFGGIRGKTFESPDTLQRLRRENAPSQSSRVWIGAVRVMDSTFSWLSSLACRDADDDYEFGVVGVFTIGAVVFHVYGAFEPPPGRQARLLHVGADMRDSLVPIWPSQVEEVRWPPITILTSVDLQRHWPGGGVILAKPR
jgi:hypothetical protein